MHISVVIPTFQRPDYLIKTLSGLENQRRTADQIVVGTRKGDDATAKFLAEFGTDRLPIEVVTVTAPGVIASMNAAIAKTTGDIICLLDDDSEPLPDWIEKIEAHFTAHPQLGALGGRDLLQDEPEMRRQESTTEVVGLLTSYGRIIGGHHRGTGDFRRVDIFKGCNAAVRGDLMRGLGLEARLLGKGAQVHWELGLCLDIQSQGYFIAYDSGLRIIHHIAPRLDDDQIHRGKFSRQALYDMVYNEHFCIHSRLGGSRRNMHLLWSLLVGTLVAPGLLQYLRGKALRQQYMDQKLKITLRATRKGMRDGKYSSSSAVLSEGS